MATSENKTYGIKRMTINYQDKNCSKKLNKEIMKLIQEENKENKEIAIVCIGTDRATGDCFAPLIGTLLSKRNSIKNKCKVYGTLQNPIHAKNLNKELDKIDLHNLFVIALDASISDKGEIGDIKLTNSMLTPGSAKGADLRKVGNISICGVVGRNFIWEDFQNVHLGMVYDMAEKVEKSIVKVINNYNSTTSNIRKYA